MVRKGPLCIGVALVAGATLMFELTLTRFFAVAEWYHFAFLSISVALLGYASSGTILSCLSERNRGRLLVFSAYAFAPTIVSTWLLINTIPFDSYQLAWDTHQIGYLIIYYLALVVPFALSGLLVAIHLAQWPAVSHLTYAANLVGSALGAAGLLLALPTLGIGTTVLSAALLGATGAGLLLCSPQGSPVRRCRLGMLVVPIIGCLAIAALLPEWSSVRLSPYKPLSYALRALGARHTYEAYSASSRVDVVESERIHVAPGLSLNFRGRLPPQYGLTTDGGDLSPISRRSSPEDRAFLNYMPSTLAFALRPGASALLIRPRGGLDVAIALHQGARRVVISEDNRLVVYIVNDRYDAFVGSLYRDPRVKVMIEDSRSTLQRAGEGYDVIQICLAESFHPLTSASYSLSENYLYTVEAVAHGLCRLNDNGLLVMSRWLQDPPSESLRAAALLVTALEDLGVKEAERHLVAFRSWSTMTLLASPSPFSLRDIATLRAFCERLGYDLVYYPGITEKESNQHNLLPEPLFYRAIQRLLYVEDRDLFYDDQPFDVRPPTDDRPFFGHYFRWRQVPATLAQLGKTWQPFGGSGFLLVLALLVVAIAASALFALSPLLFKHGPTLKMPHVVRLLAYFASIGLGFLLIEMPLMQQFILYLGQPALSFIVVLSALLLFSGIGSSLSRHLSLRSVMPALFLCILIYPSGLSRLFARTLSWPLGIKGVLSAASLLPLGILMGVPFAGGLRAAERAAPGIIPWVWAINGSASVIATILATIVALSGGYRLVLGLAAACYVVAGAIVWPLADRRERSDQ